MKRLVFFIAIQSLCCITGFSGNPRWKVFGKPIPAHGNYAVRWNAPTNDLPSTVCLYRLMPHKFSVKEISSVLKLCSLTEKDQTEQTSDGLSFQSKNGERKLSISFPTGGIDYKTASEDRLPTDIIKGIPTESEAVKLTKKLLPKIGVSLTGLRKGKSSEPDLHVSAAEITLFPTGKPSVNIIKWRAVSFRRAIDGMVVSGGDGGSIHFGEGGKVSNLSISWRDIERIKLCATQSPNEIVESFHEGRAFQGFVPGNFGGSIDWQRVKSITVIDARPCYCSGNSSLLFPFFALTATVETDRGSVDLEIDCPMIDESQPIE